MDSEWSYTSLTATFTTTITQTIHSPSSNNDTRNMNTTLPVKSNGVILKELQLFILFTLLFTGLFLNTALILVFVTRRITANRHSLLLNLTLSNCIALVFILPWLIISIFYPGPNKGVDWPCNILLTITETWWISQNYTLVAISYERYKNIAQPLREHAREAREAVWQRSIQLILCIWALTVVAVIIILLSPWITCRYDKTIFRCRKIWEDHPAYNFIYPLISFWFPGFTLTYFHVYMFYKSYKLQTAKPTSFGSSNNISRSWSLNSIADFINTVHLPTRRLSRSESLPGGLDVAAKLERERSASFSGRVSRAEGSDYSVQKRKRSLTNTPLKSIITTLKILIPYLLASAPEVILIYFYSDKTYTSNQQVDLISKLKYLLVAWFPYVLGFRDKEIKKELRKMKNRLSCLRSSQVSPSPNITPGDYPGNVFRRDSRRGSMISRRNSMGIVDDPVSVVSLSYYRGNTIKTNPLVGLDDLVTSSRDPAQIFYINSPINMPVIDV